MKDAQQPRGGFKAAAAGCVVILSCAVLAGSPLSAGVVMNLETTDHTGPEPGVETSQLAVDGERLKMDLESSAEDGLNHALIFRGGEQREILVVNHGRKTFQVMDRESIAALGSEMRLAMSEALRKVEALPPEQRAVVQKMLGSQLGVAGSRPAPPPSTVLRTSERETFQGLACVKYEVFLAGERIREVWVTPWSAVPGAREAMSVLRDMSGFYGELMESFERLAVTSFGGGFTLDHHPFDELQRMNGVPVVTRNYERGGLSTEIVLRSVREEELDPSDFEPPAGYRRTAMGPR